MSEMMKISAVKNAKRFFLIGLLLVGMATMQTGGMAAADVLDDSLSPQKNYSTQFRWVHQKGLSSLSQESFFLLEGIQSGVEVRLDTSGYKGTRARIYLGLPHQIEGLSSSGQLVLSWDTDRIFSPGEVRPGNRTLIYDGTVDTDLMIEIFKFTLRVNANYITGKIRYAPVYEIEPY